MTFIVNAVYALFLSEAILALLKTSFIVGLNPDQRVPGMGIRISKLTQATSQESMDTGTVVAMAMEVMVVMAVPVAGQGVTQTTHTVNVAAALSFTSEGTAMVATPTSTPSAIPTAILAYTAVAILFVVTMDFMTCTQALTTQDMATGTTDHKGFEFCNSFIPLFFLHVFPLIRIFNY